MSRGRLLFGECLQNTAVFALLYGLSVIPAYAVLQSVEGALCLLALAAPYFTLLQIRLRVNNLFVFLLLHALAFVVATFVPGRVFLPQSGSVHLDLVLGAFMALSCILSISNRVRRGRALQKSDFDLSLVIAGLVLLTSLAMFGKYLGYEAIVFLFPLLAVVLLACYLLYAHIDNIDNSLELITMTTVQPTSSILSFNNKAIAGYVAFVALAAAVSRYFKIDEAIGLLGALLLALLRFIFSLWKPAEAAPLEENASDMGGGADILSQMMGEPMEPSLLFVVLEKIARYLVFIGLILAVLASLAYAFYRLYRKFYSNPGGSGDQKEFIQPMIETKKAGSFAGLVKSLLFAGNMPDDKIRRQFYRKVKRLMARGAMVSTSDTPHEIAEAAKGLEDIEPLVAIYEEARYGK